MRKSPKRNLGSALCVTATRTTRARGVCCADGQWSFVE